MAILIGKWLNSVSIKWFIMVLWAFICVLLFYRTYNRYKYEPRFYYVHQMLGSSLCISRGSAAVINLNCGLVLLPMCRVVVTSLRGILRKMSMYTMRVIIDSCKGFHIACAYAIVLSSVIHYTAHVINARNFSMNYNRIYTNVNAAKYQYEDPLWIILGTVSGTTGIMMMFILCLVVTTSLKYIRDNNYDLFWFSHRLIVLMYILLMVHAFRGPIRMQLNIKYHTPGCKFRNLSFPWPEPEFYHAFKSYSCDEEPQFGEIGCQSYLWVTAPILLYIGDVVYRIRRRSTSAHIIQTVLHDDVIELKMVKDGLTAHAGQYVLLQFPAISVFEWHPYSLTSCPKKGSAFTVHIRSRGDWSGRLRKLIEDCQEESHYINEEADNIARTQKVKVNLDGPFSSPMEDMSTYRLLLCIAGGIGITPFASFLDAFRTNKKQQWKFRRIYLIWINKNIQNIRWFGELIHSLHEELWESNLPDIFDVRFHFTEISKNLCDDLPVSYREYVRKRLTYGRPDWKELFNEIVASHSTHRVGVFACGPKQLTKNVKKQCWRKYSNKTTFDFHEEIF
ncbi:NADPH oxidase 4-like [Octopus sinensis]|uniref:NADPH oxidase 4-like n=1 Tax=Octopus sinensis TaxID=2607531 RepID=A0A6P7TGW9_9MOLL|nr:NADPH oxidase 4-like [Octopus sinensis]